MAEAVTEVRGAQQGALAGKSCVVMGFLNRWSIAAKIAEAMAGAGGRVAITYADDRSKRDVDALVGEMPGGTSYRCNVESDEELDAMAEALGRDFCRVDALVHAIGFTPADALKGRFLDTSRDGFRVTLSVSAYSLIAATQRVVPLMTDGGSITTLTYLGSERVFPPYKVMGVAKAALEATVRYLAADLGEQRIRVNAISAGPIKTAAARGISGFADMHGQLTERAPLKEPFGAEQVAPAAVFLASDGAAAITGETIFVDNGYHAMGM